MSQKVVYICDHCGSQINGIESGRDIITVHKGHALDVFSPRDEHGDFCSAGCAIGWIRAHVAMLETEQ